MMKKTAAVLKRRETFGGAPRDLAGTTLRFGLNLRAHADSSSGGTSAGGPDGTEIASLRNFSSTKPDRRASIKILRQNVGLKRDCTRVLFENKLKYF